MRVDVFAALADPVRRDLVLRLAGGSSTVGALAAAHPISRPAVSRHLRVLREAGLVTVNRVGRHRVHVLDPTALAPVHKLMSDLAHAAPGFPEHALAALDLEVRRTVREHRRPDDTEAAPEEDAG